MKEQLRAIKSRIRHPIRGSGGTGEMAATVTPAPKRSIMSRLKEARDISRLRSQIHEQEELRAERARKAETFIYLKKDKGARDIYDTAELNALNRSDLAAALKRIWSRTPEELADDYRFGIGDTSLPPAVRVVQEMMLVRSSESRKSEIPLIEGKPFVKQQVAEEMIKDIYLLLGLGDDSNLEIPTMPSEFRSTTINEDDRKVSLPIDKRFDVSVSLIPYAPLGGENDVPADIIHGGIRLEVKKLKHPHEWHPRKRPKASRAV